MEEDMEEIMWELMKKPIGMIMANCEAEAEIYLALGDFDGRDYVWKMDVLLDLSAAIDAKINEVQTNEKLKGK